MKLHIDIETYSSVDIRKSGAYKYTESPDFEILLIAYAIDDEPIKIIDFSGTTDSLNDFNTFEKLLLDPNIEKHAHNATFERLSFRATGFNVPIHQWQCSMVKAAYCGLPLALDKVSEVLKLGDKGKLSTGTALINYFCKPCNPTKTNGGRTRNLPEHNPEKWEEFKRYCINDVEAEREVIRILSPYELPPAEIVNYIIDQEINDRGIMIDTQFATNATEIDDKRHSELITELKELTGLENPNSDAQLKEWLRGQGLETQSLAKESVESLLKESCSVAVNQVLELRQKSKKTSTKKYVKMLDSVCKDQRGRGYFQFYGANRTGRWAGRFVQLQNLPKNHLADLDVCRQLVKHGDFELMKLFFEDISDTLSQLIRTAFVAKADHTFVVADYSAIEARVLSWLAGETWRLKVFNSHGKIYEASASAMFSVPIEEIGKGSPLRQKGKIAELALGYGGSIGALTQMGGEKMGLSESDMSEIVKRWRAANPKIVEYWKRLEGAAKRTIETRKPVHVGNITFLYDRTYLTIQLPSGRKLFYYKPGFTTNRFGGQSIKYWGMDQTTKQWTELETYGGKLTENVVQAISRDLLAYTIHELNAESFDVVMHVHDEAVAEVPKTQADQRLNEMCEIMANGPEWSEGLPLNADGYITNYYKKD